MRVTRHNGRFVALALGLGLSGCSPPAPSTTIQSPGPPSTAADSADPGIVKSVQTYLRVFRLNEKDLPAGLTIAFGFPRPGWDKVDSEYVTGSIELGTATTTGRTGPQGHQIYGIGGFRGSSGGIAIVYHRFVESRLARQSPGRA